MADLLPLIPVDVLAGLDEEIVLLDRFYIPTRYPDALPGTLEDGLPDKEESQEALDLAKKVLEIIGGALQS